MAKSGGGRRAIRPKPATTEFNAVFARLKEILKHHAGSLFVKIDKPGNYYLETISTRYKGRRLFFGAVQIKKNYVSFHLMPVYACPKLLNGISPELKRRMQGKSCFNFTKGDDELFKELARLTAAGIQQFRAKKWL